MPYYFRMIYCEASHAKASRLRMCEIASSKFQIPNYKLLALKLYANKKAATI